jgi:hypothetical protein
MDPATTPVVISALALAVSGSSAFFAFLADRRARQSVRPYLTTEVHLSSDDMSVLLSNYGAGVAIITNISIYRDVKHPERSFRTLLLPSQSYEAQAIDFVQDRYYMRPGDKMRMVVASQKGNNKSDKILRDWARALDGINIKIDYHDIFGKRFHYSRPISTKEYF